MKKSFFRNFTEVEKALWQEVVSFSESTLNEGVVERNQLQVFDKALWKKCGGLLLQGLSIETGIGGKGLSNRATMIALEALGYSCKDNGLSFALGAHLLACVTPIALYGSDEQKQKYLPNLCNGTWIAANAITEKTGGSDAFNMNSLAVLQDDGTYALKGDKVYCSNAPVADVILAYLMTNPKKGMLGGVSAFILQRDKNHFRTGEKVDKMGLRSCLMGNVVIDSTVSTETMLGKEGAGAIMFNKSMAWERIGLSALHFGTICRLFDDVIEYVKSRVVFSKKLSSYQSISHKLVDLKVEIDATRNLIYEAASQLGQRSSIDTSASVVKLKTSELYKRAATDILQIYGAVGYVNNSHIERTVRDALASTMYSGTSAIQKNIIARHLGL